MIGFRSKTPWKMILAITYFSLCFLGFTKGVYFGIAFLILLGTLPVFINSVYVAIRTTQWDKLYSIPVWFVALAICIIMFNAYNDGINPVLEETETAATDASVAADEIRVAITESGGKYHSEDCRFVKDKEYILIGVNEAQSDGKIPCDVCLK